MGCSAMVGQHGCTVTAASTRSRCRSLEKNGVSVRAVAQVGLCEIWLIFDKPRDLLRKIIFPRRQVKFDRDWVNGLYSRED